MSSAKSSANPQLSVLDRLKDQGELASKISFDHLELMPPLILAASLLYMMAADGDIDEAESSQLQSVLGDNEELLSCAISYVQSVPLDQFLKEAPEVLSAQDKLCILTNVCDSLLSDGSAAAAELELFARFLSGFQISDEAFAPYYQAIALKNDKSVLGDYAAADNANATVSSHLALAASLVYIMAADGSIGQEEIGRLRAVIGEFEGLQGVALKYVLKVKSRQFFAEIAPTLDPQIKRLILTNVCDTLLTDGSMDPAEKKLFLSMLSAFGESETTFAPYFEAIRIKNIKPFDFEDFATSAAAQVFRSAKYQASQAQFNASRNYGSKKEIGTIIHHTMQDNIDSVANNFGNEDTIHTMSDNANNLQNIQKVQTTASLSNIQKISSDAPQDKDPGVHVVRTVTSDEDGKIKKDLLQHEQRHARHGRHVRAKRLTAVQESNGKVRTFLFFLKAKYDPKSLVPVKAPQMEIPRIRIPSLADVLALPAIQNADASLRKSVAILKNTNQPVALATGSALTLAVLLGLGAFGAAPVASPRLYAEVSSPMNPLACLFDKALTARSPWGAGKASCQLHNKPPLKMMMISTMPKA
ncbi:MAG: TerB family tellurite resistance protein [Sulfuritalea sp.]|nr:TerB family tellurite resistance protein [Sulfuritalea sp.]